ncbi:MAG: hypothetical protein LBP26_04515, partial [Clostridiales bacterium]|nr:hypothetical protein [Clostridiales bacterium]
MFRKRRAPEPPVTGPRYESVLDEGKLAALQEGKSFLTFLAVLLYAVALNLPSKAVGAFYSNHKIFAATFLVIHIAAFLYMVSIALRSDKKHRIRKAVRACDAPRFGFDKRTYV